MFRSGFGKDHDTGIRRICILGAVGSGKTTLARELSSITGIPCHELDNVVYAEGPGSVKRTPSERDLVFNGILGLDTWIVEGVHREYFNGAFAKADCVVILETPLLTRNMRIVKRWLNQRRGVEWANYEPTVRMLCRLLKWSNRFNTILKDIHKQLEPHADKVVSIRDNDANGLVARMAGAKAE